LLVDLDGAPLVSAIRRIGDFEVYLLEVGELNVAIHGDVAVEDGIVSRILADKGEARVDGLANLSSPLDTEDQSSRDRLQVAQRDHTGALKELDGN